MAEIKKNAVGKAVTKPVQNNKPKSNKLVKVVVIFIVLLLLAGTGFAIGIYLKAIDVEGMADKIKEGKNPFEKPQHLATNFEPIDLDAAGGAIDANKSLIQPPQALPVQPLPQPINQPDQMNINNKVKLTNEEKEAAKRVSKMARLYSEMKPEEAAGILQNMDDSAVIAIMQKMEEENAAKILALFDSRRAAQITNLMMRPKVVNPTP